VTVHRGVSADSSNGEPSARVGGMRQHQITFVLVIGLLVLGSSNESAPQRVVTGTVRDMQRGEWIAVANEGIAPDWRIALAPHTIYEARGREGALPADALRRGLRVTVWYRGGGESRPVADRVRLDP
jgi:hypothetical protein